MFLLFMFLMVTDHISMANGAKLRTVRSVPNDQQLCDNLSNSGYSEFIVKEAVVIQNDQPLFEGLVMNSKFKF